LVVWTLRRRHWHGDQQAASRDSVPVPSLPHQRLWFAAMSDVLPRTITRPMQFEHGCANGMSHRWQGGQYCSIMTRMGIVGCGIYDLKTAAEFGQAIAIARGTPTHPLVEPEDLLQAKIVDATAQAKALGITIGMTGREAVERMLAAEG
jgi:uncharacterized protein YunC (DUF1805 family)